MYYPIQIPYLLNQKFSQSIRYTETPAPECSGFVICFWEMQPRSAVSQEVTNVIVTDACIDLVAGYDRRQIGFTGMSKTNFHFRMDSSEHYIGARMMPGAFRQLTGLPASAAMDNYLPVEAVFPDFENEQFFALSFAQAGAYFKDFFRAHTAGQQADTYTSLFHQLSDNLPHSAKDLYQQFHLGSRQCQRIFANYYGITPKMALSVLRFQKCLAILMSSQAGSAEILEATMYYDQPHFIKDFKKNLGITPLELVGMYQI